MLDNKQTKNLLFTPTFLDATSEYLPEISFTLKRALYVRRNIPNLRFAQEDIEA